MKLSISNGNMKMGQIPSVSLPPGLSCPPKIPCFKDCYANKGYLIPARQAWTRNMMIYQEEPETYFIQLAEFLSSHRLSVRFFRFHIGGDFPDLGYIEHCINIAQAFKEVNFLAFTKCYGMISAFSFPSNFTVIASAWPGLPMPRKIKKKFRIAWMQNGEEKRIPKSAILCPGYCDACGMCWQIEKIGKDVVFHKH